MSSTAPSKVSAKRVCNAAVTALAAWPDTVATEADEDGICYIGMDRSPVTGRGTALLASLMIQRMGRRPGDCVFPFIRPSEAADETSAVLTQSEAA